MFCLKHSSQHRQDLGETVPTLGETREIEQKIPFHALTPSTHPHFLYPLYKGRALRQHQQFWGCQGFPAGKIWGSQLLSLWRGRGLSTVSCTNQTPTPQRCPLVPPHAQCAGSGDGMEQLGCEPAQLRDLSGTKNIPEIRGRFRRGCSTKLFKETKLSGLCPCKCGVVEGSPHPPPR